MGSTVSDRRNPLYSWPSPQSEPLSPTTLNEVALYLLNQRGRPSIREQLIELQEFLQNFNGGSREASSPPQSNLKSKASLQVDTNIPRVSGPRAPTRETFPELNRSNVSTANIVAGSRRRR